MVKEIICKNGEVALCDDEDYALLSRFIWYMGSEVTRGGYPCCFIYGRYNTRKQVFMHQMVMAGATNLDHINHVKLDNRKENLRVATAQQNNINKPKAPLKNGKPTASKYKGVQPCGKKWRAMIGHNRKVIQLGSHYTEDEAARAYNAKAKELYGDYAWLNPVPERPNV